MSMQRKWWVHDYLDFSLGTNIDRTRADITRAEVGQCVTLALKRIRRAPVRKVWFLWTRLWAIRPYEQCPSILPVLHVLCCIPGRVFFLLISSDSDSFLGNTTTTRDGPSLRCPAHWRSSDGAIRVHFSSRVCQRGHEATTLEDEGELCCWSHPWSVLQNCSIYSYSLNCHSGFKRHC